MAEIIKRRVAAARLAVAFAVAGTIAGAGWAQAGPQPPVAETSSSPVANMSASDYLLKVGSDDVLNGSLLFRDFKKNQVPSALQFNKLQRGLNTFKKTTNASLGTLKTQIDGIKGELGSFVKLADADARYIKLSDSVVRGDGSVFSASQLVDPNSQTFTPLLAAPGLLQVDTMGQTIRITNTSGGDLGHTECLDPQQQGNIPAGTLSSGQSIECFADSGSTASIQFFSWGREASATISFSSVTDVSGQTPRTQNTVQILIGL